MSEENQSLLEFPCRFPIKIVGKAADDFIGHVMSLISPHYPELSEQHITIRESKGKHYIAVTATIEAQSQAQLDAIYQALSNDPRVVMAL